MCIILAKQLTNTKKCSSRLSNLHATYLYREGRVEKREKMLLILYVSSLFCKYVCRSPGKNNGFPFLDILGYLKNTHKNPKFGKVRQVPTREFPTKFPDWDLSHSSKFGIFVGIL